MTHPAVLETTEAFGETTLTIDPAKIVEVCRHLKEDENFIRLSAVTAVDQYPAEPRFEVIYHLHSIDTRQPNLASKRLRLKCRLAGTDPQIESVTSVWRSANWYEREVFDMFGVKFLNHPNLQRILMPTDWDGYPLRKDYPVHGYKYGYQNE